MVGQRRRAVNTGSERGSGMRVAARGTCYPRARIRCRPRDGPGAVRKANLCGLWNPAGQGERVRKVGNVDSVGSGKHLEQPKDVGLRRDCWFGVYDSVDDAANYVIERVQIL